MAKEVVREKVQGVPETWVDSLGRTRQHTGLLQHEGRPNDEPEPEIPVELQFMPGDGSQREPDDMSHLLEPGKTNPEPEPEIDEEEQFMPGTGEQPDLGGHMADRPVMIVENPDSLIPEFPGLVARGDEGHPRVANRNAPEDAPRAPLTASDGRVAGQISGAEAASGERQSADARAARGADARRAAESRETDGRRKRGRPRKH
jgi:hypothetical protein